MCHVGQRVAAEVDEALVGADRSRIDLQDVCEQCAQVGGRLRRFVGSTRDVPHGLIVRFARRQQRQLIHGDHADCGGRKAGGRHRNALYGMLIVADRGDHEPLVIVGAEGCHTVCAQCGLHPLQVDAQAIDLDEAAAAADHLVETVGCPARNVTGAQSVDGFAQRQVGRGPCA